MRVLMSIIYLITFALPVFGFYSYYHGAILPFAIGFILSGIFSTNPFTAGIWYFLVEAFYFKQITILGLICLGCWAFLVLSFIVVLIIAKYFSNRW